MNDRTLSFVQAVRAHYGAMLQSVSDDAIAAAVWRVSSAERAVAKAQSLAVPGAVEALIGKPPEPIVNISTDATLVVNIAAPVSREQADAFEMVELYVDDAVVGCGKLRFVVVERGESVVRLFQCAKLSCVTVDRKFFDKHAVPARKVNRRKLAEIITANRALADRINDRAERLIVPDGGDDAVKVLALLGYGSNLS